MKLLYILICLIIYTNASNQIIISNKVPHTIGTYDKCQIIDLYIDTYCRKSYINNQVSYLILNDDMGNHYFAPTIRHFKSEIYIKRLYIYDENTAIKIYKESNCFSELYIDVKNITSTTFECNKISRPLLLNLVPFYIFLIFSCKTIFQYIIHN
jgi:hypothetical protein